MLPVTIYFLHQKFNFINLRIYKIHMEAITNDFNSQRNPEEICST